MIRELGVNEVAEDLHSDVCIIGGGAAGITLASRLADESDASIVVLEAGTASYSTESQQEYRSEHRPEFFPDPQFSRLRMLGGSSNHWENSIERLRPIDFEIREWLPESGWPITYSDLVRYYSPAERLCGIRNSDYTFEAWAADDEEDFFGASESFESVVAKSPLRPTRFSELATSIARDSDRVNILLDAALTTVDFDRESNSVLRVHALSSRGTSAKVTSKAFVIATGGIENARILLALNELYDDRLGNQGGSVGRYFMEHPTVRAAHYLPFDDERENLDEIYVGKTVGEQRIHARAALRESAQRELLASSMRMFFSPKSALELSTGIASSHVLSDSVAEREVPDNVGWHLSRILGDIPEIAEQALEKNQIDFEWMNYVREFEGYQVTAMMEQYPNRENKIILGEKTAANQFPLPRINYSVSSIERENTWKVLEKLGADSGLIKRGRLRVLKQYSNRIWGNQIGYGQHHMGTTRMALDPNKGVVDQDLRVFGTDNLFVAGSSVFPTGGHVPPTLTIVALALRLADHLNAEWFA